MQMSIGFQTHAHTLQKSLRRIDAEQFSDLYGCHSALNHTASVVGRCCLALTLKSRFQLCVVSLSHSNTCSRTLSMKNQMYRTQTQTPHSDTLVRCMDPFRRRSR